MSLGLLGIFHNETIFDQHVRVVLDKCLSIFDNVRADSEKAEEIPMAITARQRRVLDYIKHYFEEHQEAPTIAEIGQEFGMSSSASVHHVVSLLEREGFIRRIPNVSRGIELVKDEPAQEPLRVRGDSMIDEQIREGDFIVLQSQQTADNGQTVVALIDGSDATVKRFYGGRNQVRLEAANPRYKPIVIRPPERVQIQGVVVGVIRKYKH